MTALDRLRVGDRIRLELDPRAVEGRVENFDITAMVTSVFIEGDDRAYPLAGAYDKEWAVELIGRTFPTAENSVIGYPDSFSGHSTFVLRNDGYWCTVPNRLMSEQALRDLNIKISTGDLVRSFGWDFDVLAAPVSVVES